VALKGFSQGHLACGCRLSFREGADDSPVTVMLDMKSPSCAVSWHVSGLPLYDHREAIRMPTRLLPPREEGFEEEG